MTQKELFADQTRFDKWATFHTENPDVFRLFQRFAEEAIRSGRPRFSAHAIGNRIRWFTSIETTDPEYKINDHHWPYYSRLLMDIDKRFEGFFVVKDQRFDADVSEIVRVHRGR
jgi:hypothetical protein